MGSSYRHPALKQLKEQQARFAPRERRLEQIDRAEQLLGGDRRRSGATPTSTSASGSRASAPRGRPPWCSTASDVRHDLRLFVEDLSATVGQKAEQAAEPVLTVDAVSRRFNVSTRTVTRWRRQGLVARRFIIDGRTKVGFLESSLSRFVDGAPRPGRPGDPVPATDRRGARRDRPPRPADGAGRPGGPGRDRAEDRPKDGTLHRDRPDDAEGLRPRPPRPRDLPPLDRPARRRGQGPDLPALPPRASRSRSWPRQFGRTRSSIYRVINEMRARRHPGASSSNSCRTRASTTRPPAPRSSARCPSRPTARPRGGPRPPRGCPPTWPASTRSRC